MRQIPLPIVPDAARTFDTFLVGDNRAAVEHLRQLTLLSAPTYLWGAVGSGKSHLLHALTSAWQARGARVGWFSSDRAIREYAREIWRAEPVRG